MKKIKLFEEMEAVSRAEKELIWSYKKSMERALEILNIDSLNEINATEIAKILSDANVKAFTSNTRALMPIKMFRMLQDYGYFLKGVEQLDVEQRYKEDVLVFEKR